MARKPVRVRVVTKIDSSALENEAILDEVTQYLGEGNGESSLTQDESGLPMMNEMTPSDDDGPTMLETKGYLNEDNGEITLEFASHLLGMLPTTVSYRFSDSERDVLTVTRGSIYERVYFFENKCRRQTVMYDADGISIELGIYTKMLKNNMTYENGGYIEVEYYADIRGGVVEHCKEYVLAEPI